MSLGARLFLAFGLLLVLAVGGAMAVNVLLVRDIATDEARSSLSSSQSVQRYFRDLRARQVALVAELIASDPFFSSYVGEAMASSDAELAARSVADLLQQSRNEFDLDLAMVLDLDGRVLARTDRTTVLDQALDAPPLVERARTSLTPTTGLWSGEEGLYQATVLPIARGRTVVGFLVAALAIDDALANDVKRVSGADVAYLSAEGPRRVLATTLDVAATDRLLRELDEGVARDASTTREIELDGDRWILQETALEDQQGERFGHAVALTSLDRELAAYSDIPLLTLITGLVATALALLLSYLISQRILQPVRRLTSAAEAAAEGDYRRDLGTAGRDEIGRLSRAFDSLLSTLREKQDMEDYMVDMARHAPFRDDATTSTVPAAAESPTVDLDLIDANVPIQDTEPTPTAELNRAGIDRKLGQRYRLLSEIGSGAMGVVFRAEDRDLDEVVAIKMLKADSVDAERLEQLKGELKLARRITHPNVLRTYDFGIVDGSPFISMEYVDGLTLRELLSRRGRLPYGAALRIARQLCAGLDAVHDVGVLHRDIKPGNILLEPRGNAKLMDFGIAQPSRADVGAEDDLVTGTPEYIAPEQLTGSPPSVRSDLYALGVVFEELFTGGMPFKGETPMQAALARVTEDPIPPSHYWAAIPTELEQIILRCLARHPDDRFQDVAQLIAALGELRG
jgi:HAMP domain-containing protein